MLTKANAANAAVAGTVGGGGMLWWLDEHAAGLGALAALIGVIIALVFHILNYIENKKHHKKLQKRKTTP